MDEIYRNELDEGMSDALKALEGKARERGDYCKKHNRYIGDAKMYPWCEIDALNERCCPGDLRPSVVMKWPMAARRAMMYFQVEIGQLTERVEELREASASWRRVAETLESEKVTAGGRVRELEEALRPFAKCSAEKVHPTVDPSQQFIYAPECNFKEVKGISLRHILDARRALKNSTPQEAEHE